MTNTLMLAAAFGLLSAAPAFAQSAQADTTDAFDSRWKPYLGCWRVLDEQVDAQAVPVAKGLTVCVRPSGPSGVAITTTVDGKNVLEQTIVSDGSAHPLSEENCQGTQTSQWSRDGERLFTRVELACAGRPKRTVSGITQVTGGRWVEAQATLIDNEQHDVRLRRFQRTGDQPTGVSTLARAPMNVEDVIEASGKALSPAVEAALVESGGRFTLNSRTLKQLADAGVSPQCHRRHGGAGVPGPLSDRAASGLSAVGQCRERRNDVSQQHDGGSRIGGVSVSVLTILSTTATTTILRSRIRTTGALAIRRTDTAVTMGTHPTTTTTTSIRQHLRVWWLRIGWLRIGRQRTARIARLAWRRRCCRQGPRLYAGAAGRIRREQRQFYAGAKVIALEQGHPIGERRLAILRARAQGLLLGRLIFGWVELRRRPLEQRQFRWLRRREDGAAAVGTDAS